MKLCTGIKARNLPALFATSRKRIILHVAVYGAFARSRPHRRGLETALERPGFEGQDAIVLEPGCCAGWNRPFLDALRFGISSQAVVEEVVLSRRFMDELARRHPGKVRLHLARRLPCLPVVIADDSIAFGQYAHAGAHAPQGFWGLLNADVGMLLRWAERGRPPEQATPEDVAAFRLVNECVRHMHPCGVAAPPPRPARASRATPQCTGTAP